MKKKRQIRAREPINQYQFEKKQEYREKVWEILAQGVKDVSTANVLFFPGRHGLEIEIALRNGFQERNLIACDENTALLATAKWRKDYPKIKCYGTKLSRTIERFVTDKIRLDAANLDYCSNLCTEVIDDLRKLLSYKVTQPNMVLGITLLKGREDKMIADIARLVFKEATGAVDRMGLIQSLLEFWGYSPRCLLKSEYRSDTKNMVFGIFVIATQEWIDRHFTEFFESCEGEVDALMQLDNEIITPQSFESYQVLQKQFEDRRDALEIKYRDFQNGLPHRYYYLFATSEAGWKWHLLFKFHKRQWRPDFQQELRRTRQLLIKSESEKAQILQGGRAYK